MQELVVDDVYDVFESLNEEYHNPKEIKRMGDNVLINCPFHDDEHPTMSVYNKHDDVAPFGYGRCWACGRGWSLETIIAQLAKVDPNEWLQEHGYIVDCSTIQFKDLLGGWEFNPPKPVKETVYMDKSLIEDYCKLYHPYMQMRGISMDTCKKFKVGYDIDAKAITFPVFDENDNLLTVTRRCVDNKTFILEKGIEKPIYLIDNAVKQEQMDLKNLGYVNPIYIVESQINALTLEEWGYTALALFGTGCVHQYDKIRDTLLCRKFYLCFDGDVAGDIGAKRFKNYFKNSVRVPIPQGKDINDLSKKEFDLILEEIDARD